MIFVRTSGFVRILYEKLQHSGAHQWNLTQWMQSAWRDSLAKNYEGGLESLGLSFPDFSLEFAKTDSMDIFYQMLFLPIMQCNTRQAAGRCPVSLSIFFCGVHGGGFWMELPECFDISYWCQHSYQHYVLESFTSLLQGPFTRSITAKHSGSWSQQTCAQCSTWKSATWAPIRGKKNWIQQFLVGD